MTRFDDDTVFYDIVQTGRDLALVGPPLLNLLKDFSDAAWTVRGEPRVAALRDLYLTQGSWLRDVGEHVDQVSIDLDGEVLRAEVSPSNVELFRDKRALLTLSKNNDLMWIADWARFYAVEHGVNAILFYDNGSDAYSPEAILDALDHPGVEVAIVVKWPFKYGPQGGNWGGVENAPWDSNFCQHGVFQHARYRFLAEAFGVLNQDIDELLIAEGGKSAFEELDGSCDGVVYPGRWIENIPTSESTPPRVTDFQYYKLHGPAAFPKWLASPSRTRRVNQWGIHQISGATMKKSSKLLHRHFYGLSTNWKWNRSDGAELDTATHARDDALLESFARVFGGKVEDEDLCHSKVISKGSMTVGNSPEVDGIYGVEPEPVRLRNLRERSEFDDLEEMIRSVAGDRRLVLAPAGGNWGDSLIRRGVMEFLRDRGFAYSTITRQKIDEIARTLAGTGIDLRDSVLLNVGGGSWCANWHGTRDFVQRAHHLFDESIVLPSTYELPPVESRGRIHYVARDRHGSLETIPNALFCHDMAFYIGLANNEIIPSVGGAGTGSFLRKDKERHPNQPAVSGSMDLSGMGNQSSRTLPFFAMLAPYDKIITDRMHVAIAGAMLGIEVELYAGNYFKSSDVYRSSLESEYPNVKLKVW